MRLISPVVYACLWLIGLIGVASGHEVNPAFLQLTETANGQFEVTWKQPLKDGMRLKLDPQFPESCTSAPTTLESATGAVVSRWTLSCKLDQGRISVDGLERTLTDVFLQINRLDGSSMSAVLRPMAAAYEIEMQNQGAPLQAYFRIGVEHIIFGYDHLLFVLGLCLLVQSTQLLIAITAFTVSHSITLGLSALAGITLPGPPVEAVIALSLVLLAREALVVQRGDISLTNRYPWMIAFGFGFIHGFGFAGALSEIGLPQSQSVWALLLFNLGVEFGQVLFMVALLTTAYILLRVAPRYLVMGKTFAAYVVGACGTLWLAERVIAFPSI